MTQPRARRLAGSTLFLSCVGLLMTLSGLSCLKKKLSPVSPVVFTSTRTMTATLVGSPTPSFTATPTIPLPTATETATQPAFPHRAVVADSGNDRVVVIEEDASGAVTAFTAYGVDAFSAPLDVDVDSATGNIWIADSGKSRAVAITNQGLRICKVAVNQITRIQAVQGTTKAWALHGDNGFLDLVGPSGLLTTADPGITITSAGDVSLDRSSGNSGGAWVCSFNPSSPCAVWQVGPTGVVGPVINSGLGQVLSVAVNPLDGSVYVANYQDKEVKIYDNTGSFQDSYYDLSLISPSALAVDPNTGYCWVADQSTIRKIRPDGSEDMAPIGGFSGPKHLAVDPSDGSLWVSDFGNDRVVKLRDDGVQLGEVTGLSAPEGIAVR